MPRSPDTHTVEATYFLPGATQEQIDALVSHCKDNCDCDCNYDPEDNSGRLVITGPADGMRSVGASVNLLQAEVASKQEEEGAAVPEGVKARWERQSMEYKDAQNENGVQPNPSNEAVQDETGVTHFRPVADAEQPVPGGSVGQAGGYGAQVGEVTPEQQAAAAALAGGQRFQHSADLKSAGIQPTSTTPGEQIPGQQVQSEAQP